MTAINPDFPSIAQNACPSGIMIMRTFSNSILAVMLLAGLGLVGSVAAASPKKVASMAATRTEAKVEVPAHASAAEEN